jgi:hypothetical protein
MSLGPALVPNALFQWQENYTMHKPEVEIGNSGLKGNQWQQCILDSEVLF